MSACPHPSPLGLYGLGCGSNNESCAPTNKRQQKCCRIFSDAFLLVALGLFVDLVLCRNEDKRAMSAASITLPRATFYACATAQTFHRRAQLDRLVLALGLYILRIGKIIRIAAMQSERGTEKDRRVKFIVQIMFFISASLFDIQCFMSYNFNDA